MSKVIKVEDQIYDQLKKQKTGRQTFSDVIEDLLKCRLTILDSMSMLEGVVKYREWQREQLEKMSTVHSVLTEK